jgi:hypothetical protein
LRRVGALRVRVNEHHDLSRDGLLPPLERRRRRNGLAGHRRARLLGRVDQRECRYSGGCRDLSHGTVASGRRHRCFARHRRVTGVLAHHAGLKAAWDEDIDAFVHCDLVEYENGVRAERGM